VKPAPFEYVRARSLDGAFAWLARDGDAKLLAGGQSLVPMMNMRVARPSANPR
jgi:carbon-monoxide dehydrogenase medium subunit